MFCTFSFFPFFLSFYTTTAIAKNTDQILICPILQQWEICGWNKRKIHIKESIHWRFEEKYEEKQRLFEAAHNEQFSDVQTNGPITS